MGAFGPLCRANRGELVDQVRWGAEDSDVDVFTQAGEKGLTTGQGTPVKKELKLDASLYTCLQILSVSIFEKTEI